MKTVSYADFSARLHASSAEGRTPVNATLELTYRCNNRCVHCYCSLPAADPEALRREMGTSEVKALLDRLADMGSLWLLITGGEPLLREDFGEIYLHARKRGFLVTLFTNATLLDGKTVELLLRYPPFTVEITLYGATRQTYELLTGNAGSFDRCMAGIRAVVGAGVSLKLKTMALTVNQHEVSAMDSFARELGCEFRFDPLLHKRIDDRDYSNPERYRLSPEEVVRLDRTFPNRMEKYRQFCDRFLVTPGVNDRLYQCGAGTGSIHITPYGNASGCSLMLRDAFSLEEHSLEWIWEEGIPSVTGQRKSFSLPCDTCYLSNLCGQCPPWSLLENRDVKKEVAYLCGIAKMREKSFEFIKRSRDGAEDRKEAVVKA